jgi:hypothetical protein
MLWMDSLGVANGLPANTSKNSARLSGVAAVLLLMFFLLYWGMSAVVLWWSYDLSPLIRGGYYEHHQASLLVTKMGLIVTVLTSVVWLFMRRRKTSRRSWRGAWTAAWQTTLVLAGYTALILARLQFSRTPASDSAFLPILGSINSHFFSEVGWMSFLINVVPIMGCVSGTLYFLHCRILESFSKEP